MFATPEDDIYRVTWVLTASLNLATYLMFTSADSNADAISVKISFKTFSSITVAVLSLRSADEIFYPNSARTIVIVYLV